jgi:hypothetical protein
MAFRGISCDETGDDEYVGFVAGTAAFAVPVLSLAMMLQTVVV